jgi:cell division protein FtsL
MRTIRNLAHTIVGFTFLYYIGNATGVYEFTVLEKILITLFAGSALAIGIMASSLEIGKLVSASFLHTYWKNIKFTLKLYLCTAVFVLMCITSLGIFGFLTNAYQVHANTVGSFETKIETLVSEKNTIEQSIAESANRIKTLVEIRGTQEQRVKDSGNYKAPRDQAYKAIAEANEEIQGKEAQVLKDRERLVSVEKEISELKISMNTTTDVGSFKFIASALNTSVEKSVQYFIFALIFVFDPLAVALVLAWNKLLDEKKQIQAQENLEYIQELKSLQPTITTTVPVVVPSSQPTTPIIKQPEIVSPVVKITNAEYLEDFEKDPNFLALSEEEKKLERARRMSAGKNDSIITNR